MIMQPKQLITYAIVLSVVLFYEPFFVQADNVGYKALTDNMIKNPSFEDGSRHWTILEHAKLVETDPHDGKVCLQGDGTDLSQVSIGAKQKIDLDAGSVYSLTFWVKSATRSSVVVHLEDPQGASRKVGGSYETPEDWTRYSFMFHAEKSGGHTLVFSLPETSRPNPGKTWLDKINLVRLGQAWPEDIGSGLFDDYPCAKSDGKGNVWMACLAFDAESKSEQIVFRKFDGKTWSAPLRIASAKQVFAPALAVNDSQQWVAWSQRDGDNWEIYARQIGPLLGRTVKVASSPAVDRNVSATATKSGDVWVAWQSDRTGRQDIFAAIVNRPDVKPLRISMAEESNYNPSILAIGDTVYVVWESFLKGNYDIFMRIINNAKLSPLWQISDSPDTDKHPVLSSDDKGRLWIAYDSSKIKKNLFGRRGGKIYALRCYDNGKLYKLTAAKTKVWDIWGAGEELPALCVSGKYGTRMACAASQASLLCWTIAGRRLIGDKWTQPELLSGRAFTTCRRPSLVQMPDGSALLIWTSTDRILSDERGTNVLGKSTVSVLKLPALAPNEITTPALEEVPLTNPPIAASMQAPPPSVQYQGKRLNIYFGDLHAHSNISLCTVQLDPLPDDLYAYCRDNAGNDFMALTDHGMHMNDYDFHVVKKLARANNQPHRFVAFAAQEWSSMRYEQEGFGHKNIIYRDDDPEAYFSPRKASVLPKPYGYANPRELWDTLRSRNAITIPHQLADSSLGACTDWSYMDKEMQPIAEILQGRGSYEFADAPRAARHFKHGHSLQDAWAKGHVLGVIASPDHGGAWGRAAVLAEELTRESLFEALKKRRCYGTTMAHIVLDFRVNGHLMGEEITVAEVTSPRHITVSAVFKDLETLVLYKNNQEILRKRITGGRIDLEFADTTKLDADKATWYYVRVEAKPGKYGEPELAWSSPIWVNVSQSEKLEVRGEK